MLSMRLLSRRNLPKYAAAVQRLHTTTLLSESSSDSSSSDSDKKSSKKKVKSKPAESPEQKLQSQQETTSRLNSLLDKMMKEPKVPKSIDLSVPQKKPKPAIVKPLRFEEKLLGAAKKVATSLGGDVKKTESELLNKLLSADKAKSIDDPKEKQPSAPLNLSEFVSKMKIDRTPQKSVPTPHVSQRSIKAESLVKKSESINSRRLDRFTTSRNADQQRRTDVHFEPGNLYKGEPLNIFDPSRTSSESPETPRLATWEALEANEFRLAQIHPPENIFQEMIMWTEQGKLWKFPIDNEQGMEEEQSVHFSEHVFMERHLQDWCPKRGPIRHFMELVCVGLSKNPYMTVKEKKDHIYWYREFFGSKQELLKEIGAIEENMNKKQEPKQIEG